MKDPATKWHVIKLMTIGSVWILDMGLGPDPDSKSDFKSYFEFNTTKFWYINLRPDISTQKKTQVWVVSESA